MRNLLVLWLAVLHIAPVYSQDGENDYQEVLPVFGLALKPFGERIITVEADYDGMYIVEREVKDLFESARFKMSEDLYNWNFYDYWITNNRGQNQPNKVTRYELVMDPTGNYLALNEDDKYDFITEISIFHLPTQKLYDEIDLLPLSEDLGPIQLIKFDATGKNLLIGTATDGTFSYNIAEKKIIPLHESEKIQLIDIVYGDAMHLLYASYTQDEFGDVFVNPEYFEFVEGEKSIVNMDRSIDYTSIFEPLEVNERFPKLYIRSYETYITQEEKKDQRVIYRNKETFKIISIEAPANFK